MPNKLSVVLSTINEESNIKGCLESVKEIVDDIVVMDESSTDRTREIAIGLGARVYKVKHEPIFHITKQKAIDAANENWVLQLDADERVTPSLGKEILEIINLSSDEIRKRKFPNKRKERLFREHQRLLEGRDGKIGKPSGEIVAFFIPRVNYFLGKPLIHAGVYPDGVIRLVKKGKARFPTKDVHEQIEINGEVAWLFNDLLHYDSPTLGRYLSRMGRYTDLRALKLKEDFEGKSLGKFIYYFITKPVSVFLSLFLIHKGILDGIRGFLWSYLSSLHYPVAFYKYLKTK